MRPDSRTTCQAAASTRWRPRPRSRTAKTPSRRPPARRWRAIRTMSSSGRTPHPGRTRPSQYSLHTDGGSGVSVLTLPGEILYLSSSCGKNGWAIWHRYHRTPAPTTSGSPGSWVYHATSALMGAAVLASPTGGMAAANSGRDRGAEHGRSRGQPADGGSVVEGLIGRGRFPSQGHYLKATVPRKAGPRDGSGSRSTAASRPTSRTEGPCTSSTTP